MHHSLLRIGLNHFQLRTVRHSNQPNELFQPPTHCQRLPTPQSHNFCEKLLVFHVNVMCDVTGQRLLLLRVRSTWFHAMLKQSGAVL